MIDMKMTQYSKERNLCISAPIQSPNWLVYNMCNQCDNHWGGGSGSGGKIVMECQPSLKFLGNTVG